MAGVFPFTFRSQGSTRNPLLDLDYGTDVDEDDDDVDMQEVAESLSQQGSIPNREDSRLSQQDLSPSPPPPRTSISDAPTVSHKRDRTSSVDEELSTSIERGNSQAQSTESSSGKLSGWGKRGSVSTSSKRQKVDFPGKLFGDLHVISL